MSLKMKCLQLVRTGEILKEDNLLELREVEVPEINKNEILIKIKASGICHTELDEIEGRAKPAKLPVILGHQISGIACKIGKDVKNIKEGERCAVGWIGGSCGKCHFCKQGLENLCTNFKATGKEIDGGYAEYVAIDSEFAHKFENNFDDKFVAPLLCAGAVGYRSLNLASIEDGENLGFVGFGASAHIVLKLAKKIYPKSKIFVFARGAGERQFAKELGADFVYPIEGEPQEKIKAIIDTTPVWKPIVCALKNLEPSGRIIINAIRKEDFDKSELINLDYSEHLWLEKEVKSVANVTRKDIKEFLELAFKFDIKPEVETFSLEETTRALREIKEKKIRGAKVITFES